MDYGSVIANLLLILITMVVCISIVRSLGFGTILGFLTAGTIIGPHVLGLISDYHSVEFLGEFGIIFLLFLIGLEIKPSKLIKMKKWVFGLGGLQVASLSILFFCIAHYFIGMNFETSLLLGISLALSSTAIDLQILVETDDIIKPYGQKSLSILLFQDLMAVVLLMIIPILASTSVGGDFSLIYNVLIPFSVLLGSILAGKYIMPKILFAVAKTKSMEAFSAISLFLVLSMAWITSLIGIPMSLGAFIAGIMMAESQFRQQIQANINPFKLIFLGTFFMYVGMSIDLSLVNENISSVAILLTFLILAKFSGIYVLFKLFKQSSRDALKAAVLLCQVGEFALVVTTLAAKPGYSIISSNLANILILTIAISMFLTPIIIKLYAYLEPKLFKVDVDESLIKNNKKYDVIIIGFGRVGKTIAKILQYSKVKYAAIDLDPSVVKKARKKNFNVYYGDTASIDMYNIIGIEKTKAVILALDNHSALESIARTLKQNFKGLKVFARVKHHHEGEKLKLHGITAFIPETLEASFQLSSSALKEIGFCKKVKNQIFKELRNNYYEKLEDKIFYESQNAVAQAVDEIDKKKKN